VLTLALPLLVASAAACRAAPPTPEELGRRMFFDPALSSPEGQACADCHAPHVAFRDPESDRSTSGGALALRYGPRNAPSIMYARFVPALRRDPATGAWTGGLFWDGRGGSLEHQAGFPLLNPVEMNNPDPASVVASVARAPYADAFRARYGADALAEPEAAFHRVADALAAYERTPELAPFSSKYDRWLRGEATLTPAEQRGLDVFMEPRAGNCASCHPPPLFTNFAYANLGIPRYANSGYYAQDRALNPDGADYVDHGLMTTVGDPAQDGKFRVPTLRNIARTGPYGHNGYFQNLQYMLDFLNTRDTRSPDPHVPPWALPEVPATVDPRVGHLGLSAQQLDDLEEFLGTLTDQLPKPPPPIKNPPRRGARRDAVPSRPHGPGG
jgi:cytochrome c peroxidase